MVGAILVKMRGVSACRIEEIYDYENPRIPKSSQFNPQGTRINYS